jgi:hypothetical protein
MSIEEKNREGKGEESSNTEIEEFDLEPVSGGDRLKKHLFMAAIIVLVASASYGLGRINLLKNSKVPIEIKFNEDLQSAAVAGSQAVNITTNEVEQGEAGFVVGSKNSDKYHFPWCSGAQRIAEENKITFTSIGDARAAGYKPAANCKGLK